MLTSASVLTPTTPTLFPARPAMERKPPMHGTSNQVTRGVMTRFWGVRQKTPGFLVSRPKIWDIKPYQTPCWGGNALDPYDDSSGRGRAERPEAARRTIWRCSVCRSFTDAMLALLRRLCPLAQSRLSCVPGVRGGFQVTQANENGR